MGRRPDSNAQYRIAVHVDKGYRYASTQPAVIDPETGKRKLFPLCPNDPNLLLLSDTKLLDIMTRK